MTSKQDIISECWLLKWRKDGKYFSRVSPHIDTDKRCEAYEFSSWQDAKVGRDNLGETSVDMAIVHLVMRKKTTLLTDFAAKWRKKDKHELRTSAKAFAASCSEKRLKGRLNGMPCPLVLRESYFNAVATSSGSITIPIEPGDTRQIIENEAGKAFMALAK